MQVIEVKKQVKEQADHRTTSSFKFEKGHYTSLKRIFALQVNEVKEQAERRIAKLNASLQAADSRNRQLASDAAAAATAAAAAPVATPADQEVILLIAPGWGVLRRGGHRNLFRAA